MQQFVNIISKKCFRFQNFQSFLSVNNSRNFAYIMLCAITWNSSSLTREALKQDVKDVKINNKETRAMSPAAF